jgi:hypothetical protein
VLPSSRVQCPHDAWLLRRLVVNVMRLHAWAPKALLPSTSRVVTRRSSSVSLASSHVSTSMLLES